MAPDPEARIILPSLGRTPAAEMDLEIAAHLQLCIDDLVRSGMEPERARVEAERRVAALRQARPALHQAARRRDAALRHRDWIGALRADARFALRQIRRNGAHSALALIMLAIGIGMSTAMFTLVKGVLLNPLPFPRAAQLVTIQGADSLRHAVSYLSNDDWIDWRRETHAFASVAAYSFPSRTTLVIGDSATRTTEVHVSGDFFRVLQARFVAGRAFTPDEVAAGTAGVVVSERFWRSHLGSDTALTQPVGASRQRVIGVLADASVWPADVDLWQPIVVASMGGGATRSNIGMYGIARLRPGVTQADASADVNRVAHLIRATDPGGLYDYGGSVRPLRDLVVEPDTISSLRLLMACVGVILLIVCANLAVGTLGRGAARGQEFAIRTSLGAARARLVVQLLVEHLVYALIGGAGGVFVGWVTVRTLLQVWGEWIPRAGEVHIDTAVLAFALGVSLVVGLLAGIIPALRVSHASLNASMKERAANMLGGRQRAASALVVAEFALAVVLVIGAGLLLRSFQRLVSRDLGFDTRTATIEVTLTGPRYARDSLLRLATWDRLMDAYRAMPSVQSVGLANWVPLGTAGMSFLDIEGDAQPNPGAGYRTVSESYFNTIGLRTLVGRVLARSDDASAERVVVVNQAFVRRYLGSSPPIGRRIRARGMESGPHGEPAPWLTVVGVVSDLRQFGFEADAAPEMYTSFRQAPQWRTTDLTAVVRTTGPPGLLLEPLRAATHSVDPHIAGDATTMASALASTLAPRRITMFLLTGFSAIALLLASLGAYAALSYAVTGRSRELALRAALGARRPALLRLVLGNGLRVAGVGIAIGVAVALAGTRLLTAMLVDITALDPATFLAAPALLLVAAVVATILPALRATRADPAGVIRDS